MEVVQHITVPAPLVAAGNGIAEGMEEADGWRTYIGAPTYSALNRRSALAR